MKATTKLALTNYEVLVANLLKPANEVRADMDKISDSTINMLHCAMGMMGEFLEMKASKTPEELHKEQGDFLFYCVGGFQALNIPLPDKVQVDGVPLEPQVFMHNSMQMENALLDVLEVTKKEFFYAKAIKPELATKRAEALKFLFLGIASLTGAANTNLAGLIENNTAKLTKRYEGGNYSNESAVARPDAQ